MSIKKMPAAGQLDPARLMRLMTWLGPSFPVGAYTYSHGVEYAIEDGRVHTRDSVIAWIEGVLAFGAGRIDGVLFCQAYAAARDGDQDALIEIGIDADCRRGTAEMALEATAQGRAFVSTVSQVWDDPLLDGWAASLRGLDRLPSYPVAVAIAAAGVDVDLRSALTAFFHAMAANLVSSAVRLVPLGQTDGIRAVAALEKTVEMAVERAIATEPEDIGACAPLVDWTSMKHETQYTRLFRS
ncbi:urease accessory protein UreF [Thalassospira profundimaris]|uniref:Urease accessory protein UreF n=1 Tax=Thalassospira profundimaris TaxID=502049 RepID=A0A367XKW0_9PROT|nr:urease accessory protein UreF [Thalassospira profundimaris]RCK54286.1 urease accessory protein UreF [Thalassospira profundimaris]